MREKGKKKRGGEGWEKRRKDDHRRKMPALSATPMSELAIQWFSWKEHQINS